MFDPRRISERIPRRVVIVVVATLLFGWVFLYRFNTLGGSFGGFDNDHFVYFALAKQVQAGEQPLRDFIDGMHGAWPSLTYELSAAAQRVFGNNLRSEAWLTVSGVALGAALAFAAGSGIAPWQWALITALLSALMSPKLYGYPKVLVTAVAALLIITYARRPGWGRLVAMSVWTAIAFLFRHDYAVYCGSGFLAVIALATARSHWRDGLTRSVAYGLIAAVLLAPSMWWIQRYQGITEYFGTGLQMSSTEYERTRIGWPVIALDEGRSPFAMFENDENAETWIYYVFVGIPLITIGTTVWRLRTGADGQSRAAALLALSLMTLVLWYAFLRGNLAARFGDMGPPVAVLGAWLMYVSTSGRPWPRTLLPGAAAIAVLTVTLVCTWQLGSVIRELGTARLLEPRDVFDRTKRTSQELAGMPRSLREAEAADRMQAADYLHRCTRPTDRVMVVGYRADVPAMAERLFAGSRLIFMVGYYHDERYMRQTVATLASQSVPIVLSGNEVSYREFRLLGEYIRDRYDEVGIVSSPDGPLRVFVRRGLGGTMSGPNGLPCFG
jgi:hypothetical protein